MEYDKKIMRLTREWNLARTNIDTADGVLSHEEYYKREIKRIGKCFLVKKIDYRGDVLVSIAVKRSESNA